VSVVINNNSLYVAVIITRWVALLFVFLTAGVLNGSIIVQSSSYVELWRLEHLLLYSGPKYF